MPWYGWVMIGYFVIDRLCVVSMIGRSFEYTPAVAVLSLITGGLLVWGIVGLAGLS